MTRFTDTILKRVLFPAMLLCATQNTLHGSELYQPLLSVSEHESTFSDHHQNLSVQSFDFLRENRKPVSLSLLEEPILSPNEKEKIYKKSFKKLNKIMLKYGSMVGLSNTWPVILVTISSKKAAKNLYVNPNKWYREAHWFRNLLKDIEKLQVDPDTPDATKSLSGKSKYESRSFLDLVLRLPSETREDKKIRVIRDVNTIILKGLIFDHHHTISKPDLADMINEYYRSGQSNGDQ